MFSDEVSVVNLPPPICGRDFGYDSAVSFWIFLNRSASDNDAIESKRKPSRLRKAGTF